MQIIDQLREIAEKDESLFRRQLAKEDIARLERLDELVKTAADIDAFKKDGLYIGWTQNDMRTHDLRDTLLVLLDAFYAAKQDPSEANEQALTAAWIKFRDDRLEKLIHCL
ncbi:MAG: hypothetical protein ACWA5T_08290 [Parvularcula sp.]